ncbi:MAG: cobalamin biosynthesis protein [Succinivibrionaceae bacterium]
MNYFFDNIWPICKIEPSLLLFAMIFEWLIPYPFFIRLNKLIPFFSLLGRRVNKFGNDKYQQIISGIFLPIVIIIPIFVCIYCSKQVTNLPEVIDFLCLLLILESRPPRSVSKQMIKYLDQNTDESKSKARTLLSRFVLRITTKLSSMGMCKAICESSTLRLINNFYIPAFVYLFLGIECAIFTRLITLMSMSFNLKLAYNQHFGLLVYRLSQIIYLIPSLLMLLIIYILPAKNKKNAFQAVGYAIQNWPSKTSGIIMTALAGIINIRLGGPRYYMLNLYRYPIIGGSNNPETQDIKKMVFITSIYIWLTIFLCLALKYAVYFNWIRF